MNNTDAYLVSQYLAGDKGAFEILYTRYQAPLFNYLYRSSGSVSLAEDVFQEVFFQVIKKMSTYKEEQNFKAWIYAIARNRLIDMGRLKSSKDVHIGDEWEFSGVDKEPSQALEDKESISDLRNCIDKMPSKTREILMLRHFSGLSFKEIASATSMPIGTVLSQVHRGLKILKEKML